MSATPSSRSSVARPRASTRQAAGKRAPGAAAGPGQAGDEPSLIFGKASYVWIGIGVALMILGMLLMAGGSMPTPDVWDESLIYSFRRITLAPIVILGGLGVITYAIFKK